MKKINLILGACAIAAAALLVSCNNGTKDYVNVKTINNKYIYNVTGSITNTSKDGTTTAYSESVVTETVKTVLANVSWNEDKLNETNYDYYSIQFSGTANWTTSYKASGATTATTSKFTDKFGTLSSNTYTTYYTLPDGWYDISAIADYSDPLEWGAALIQTAETPAPDSSTYPAAYWAEDERIPTGTTTSNNISDLSITIYEFDGDFYVKNDKEYVKLPEDAIDGDFGDDEIKIKYTLTNADTRTSLSETAKNDTTVVRSNESAIDLTLKLVDAE